VGCGLALMLGGCGTDADPSGPVNDPPEDPTQPAGEIVTAAVVPLPANYGHHDTFVRDGLAFAAVWNSGVYIYDVGNGMRGGTPEAPVLVSQFLPESNDVPGGV